ASINPRTNVYNKTSQTLIYFLFILSPKHLISTTGHSSPPSITAVHQIRSLFTTRFVTFDK
ncbi:hypothetical protein M8C21_027896, partial [Ambrosia artemisiifolia]